jgi:hypothetical protein
MQPLPDHEGDRVHGFDGSQILWRRLHPEWVVTSEGAEDRISSAAFIDNTGHDLSMHVAALTTLEEVTQAFPHMRIAAVEAQTFLDLGFTIVPDPQPDDQSHALVKEPAGHRSRGTRKRDARTIAAKAQLVI